MPPSTFPAVADHGKLSALPQYTGRVSYSGTSGAQANFDYTEYFIIAECRSRSVEGRRLTDAHARHRNTATPNK